MFNSTLAHTVDGFKANRHKKPTRLPIGFPQVFKPEMSCLTNGYSSAMMTGKIQLEIERFCYHCSL